MQLLDQLAYCLFYIHDLSSYQLGIYRTGSMEICVLCLRFAICKTDNIIRGAGGERCKA